MTAPDIHMEQGRVLFIASVAAAFLGMSPGSLRTYQTRGKIDPTECSHASARRTYYDRQELLTILDDERDVADADEDALEAADLILDWRPEAPVEPAVVVGNVVTHGVTESTPAHWSDTARALWETNSMKLTEDSDRAILRMALDEVQAQIDRRGVIGAEGSKALAQTLRDLGLSNTERHRRGHAEEAVDLYETIDNEALGRLIHARLTGPTMSTKDVQDLAERAFGGIHKFVQDQTPEDSGRTDRRLAINRG